MSAIDPLEPLKRRFRARARSDAEALEIAIVKADSVEVERLVHGLAGAAGIFGFKALGTMASALDADIAQGQTPDLARLNALVAEAKAIDQS